MVDQGVGKVVRLVPQVLVKRPCLGPIGHLIIYVFILPLRQVRNCIGSELGVVLPVSAVGVVEVVRFEVGGVCGEAEVHLGAVGQVLACCQVQITARWVILIRGEL